MEARRALRFGLTGVGGFLVDACVLALLLPSIGPWWGRAASFIAAVVFTWLVNRRFTFPDRESRLRPHHEFGRYFLAMLAGGAVNYGVYAVCISVLGSAGWTPFFALAVGSLCGMTVNLLLARLVIFRHAVDR